MSASNATIFIPRTRSIKPSLVGGFVLSGLVLAVAAILLFGGLDLFTPTQQAIVIFPGSISGLEVGAPVTFRGVQVGSVQSISVRLAKDRIDADDLSPRVLVTLQLKRDSLRMAGGSQVNDPLLLDRLLRAGLAAELDTSSLVTGQIRVELDLRPDLRTTSIQTVLGMPEIPTVASAFESIKSQIEGLQVRQLVDIAQRTLESIRHLSDQLDGRVGPLLDSVQKTSDGAHDTLRIATEAIQHVDTASTRTLGDFDRLAVEGQRQLTDRGADLARVLADADRTVHGVTTLTTSLNDMLSPRSDTRGNLDAAVRDLAATSGSLREFSREIDRDPSLLLKGGIKP
jgi:paraquat-inducible protein B